MGQIDYQYDPVGRLVRTQGERLKESFQFDPAGNLIDAAAGQHGQIKSNLIQQYQWASYRYDTQSNVIEKQH